MTPQHWHIRDGMSLAPKAIEQRTTAPSSTSPSTATTSASSAALFCPLVNGTTYTTPSNQPYQLYCHTDFRGNDLPAVHATSYADCVEQCNAYVQAEDEVNGALCIACVYNADNPNRGNCYLKYQVPLQSVYMNNTLVQAARRVQYPFDGQPVYTPYSSASTSTVTSKPASSPVSVPNVASPSPAVAKPSLGTGVRVGMGIGIAAVGLLLLAALNVFLRRRKRWQRYLKQGASTTRGSRILPAKHPSMKYEKSRSSNAITSPTTVSPDNSGSSNTIGPPTRFSHDDVTQWENLQIAELPGHITPNLRVSQNTWKTSHNSLIMASERAKPAEQMNGLATEVIQGQAISEASPKITPELSPKASSEILPLSMMRAFPIMPMTSSDLKDNTVVSPSPKKNGTEVLGKEVSEVPASSVRADKNKQSAERERGET